MLSIIETPIRVSVMLMVIKYSQIQTKERIQCRPPLQVLLFPVHASTSVRGTLTSSQIQGDSFSSSVTKTRTSYYRNPCNSIPISNLHVDTHTRSCPSIKLISPLGLSHSPGLSLSEALDSRSPFKLIFTVIIHPYLLNRLRLLKTCRINTKP